MTVKRKIERGFQSMKVVAQGIGQKKMIDTVLTEKLANLPCRTQQVICRPALPV